MSTVIEANGVSRFYGMILGLNNVSFKIGTGITGVIGPNGAGKTTLFRLLTGQIRPTSGTITVLGESPWNNPRVQARIGYGPESEAVSPAARARDWVTALGMISGYPGSEAATRAAAALERVKLAPEHWRKRMGEMSKGMKQRVKLAQCLVHEPDLVILDEPMNGLDPMGREDFGNVLRELAQGGTSIVISSHILHDLEALCASFLLLRWGRVPRSSQEATNAESRRKWPDSTTFRCDMPDRLARFFFERELLRGCEIVPEGGLLHAQWKDPETFYSRFDDHLLSSGVRIFEVRSTASFLEKAIAPPPVSVAPPLLTAPPPLLK